MKRVKEDIHLEAPQQINLLDNIIDAIDIINKNKGTDIFLKQPGEDAVISATQPVGVAYTEWREYLKDLIENSIVFSSKTYDISFQCPLSLADLYRQPDDALYTDSMKTLIASIYDAYKVNGMVDLNGMVNSGTIPRPSTRPSISPIVGSGCFTKMASSSNNVNGDMDVSGTINADDIVVDNGYHSVKTFINQTISKIGDLETENDNLRRSNNRVSTELNDTKAELAQAQLEIDKLVASMQDLIIQLKEKDVIK